MKAKFHLLKIKTIGIRIIELLKIDIIIAYFTFDIKLKNSEDTILISF